jgi:hypothetical protein
MRAFITALSVFLLISFVVQDADGKKRRKRRRGRKAKVRLKATKQTRTGINRLMGKVKWGMSSQKILNMLAANVRKEMEPGVRATRDPLEQDKKRREMLTKIKKVKKNHVEFTGKRTPWDVSLVDKEFAHKNNESMAVSWEKMERRFFFFHHDRLWKLFIAFNADIQRRHVSWQELRGLCPGHGEAFWPGRAQVLGLSHRGSEDGSHGLAAFGHHHDAGL